MSAPGYLTDPTTGVTYYVDPATQQRLDYVNGQWQVHVPPAPVPVPEPIPAPAAPPVPAMPAAPAPVPQVAAPVPAAVPPAVPMPTPAPVVPVGASGNLAALAGAAAGNIGGDLSFLGQDLGDVQTGFKIIEPDGLVCEFLVKEISVDPAKNSNLTLLNLTLVCTFPALYKGVTVYDSIIVNAPQHDTEALEKVKKSRWKLKSLMEVSDLLDPTGAKFTGNSLMDFKGHIIRGKTRINNYTDNAGNDKKNNKLDGGYQRAFETPEIPLTPEVQQMREQWAQLQAATVAANMYAPAMSQTGAPTPPPPAAPMPAPAPIPAPAPAPAAPIAAPAAPPIPAPVPQPAAPPAPVAPAPAMPPVPAAPPAPVAMPGLPPMPQMPPAPGTQG